MVSRLLRPGALDTPHSFNLQSWSWPTLSSQLATLPRVSRRVRRRAPLTSRLRPLVNLAKMLRRVVARAPCLSAQRRPPTLPSVRRDPLPIKLANVLCLPDVSLCRSRAALGPLAHRPKSRTSLPVIETVKTDALVPSSALTFPKARRLDRVTVVVHNVPPLVANRPSLCLTRSVSLVCVRLTCLCLVRLCPRRLVRLCRSRRLNVVLPRPRLPLCPAPTFPVTVTVRVIVLSAGVPGPGVGSDLGLPTGLLVAAASSGAGKLTSTVPAGGGASRLMLLTPRLPKTTVLVVLPMTRPPVSLMF